MDMSYVSNRTDEDVLDSIKSFQDQFKTARVSTSVIAERVGCHIQTVKNSVRRLEGKGRIRMLSQKGRPTAYEIVD